MTSRPLDLLRRRRLPSGRRELVVAATGYVAVLAVRHASMRPAGRARATRNAQRLARLERRLGIHVEPALQAGALSHPRLVGFLNAAYVGANLGVTAGTLAYLRRRRDPHYGSLVRGLTGSMLASQVPFLLFPTEPPRRLGHIVDTMREVSRFDLDGRVVSSFYNPLASMPSIHLAWAVISARALARCTTRPSLRRLAGLYPPAVATTVIVTGNHFVLDVLAGAALGRAADRIAPGR